MESQDCYQLQQPSNSGLYCLGYCWFGRQRRHCGLSRIGCLRFHVELDFLVGRRRMTAARAVIAFSTRLSGVAFRGSGSCPHACSPFHLVRSLRGPHLPRPRQPRFAGAATDPVHCRK